MTAAAIEGYDAASAAVDRVGAFLRERIGLRFEGTLRGRLRRSISDEAAVTGDTLDAYADRLCRGGEGLDQLVNRITVQESGFFRHPEHFEVLVDSILPSLDRPVRIWSAACANGQEAYSLAMMLEEHGVPGSVVASDLSTDALARTADGWYSSREMSGISASRRQRYLVDADRGARIAPRVLTRVTSLRHNLVDPLPGHVGSCQVVFCRNVLIYLSAEHSSAFLDRLADALAPGAYLFLGAAESLWQVSDRFQPVRLGGAFVYRRRDAGPSAPVPGSGAAAHQPSPPPPATPSPLTAYPAAPSPLTAYPATPYPVAPRRPHPPERSPGRARRPASGEVDQTAILEQSGKLALAGGDYATAIVMFRKCAYLAPDDPMGSFHLGLALEAAGHHRSARRAFAVARAALSGAGPERVERGLEGFARDELLELLDAKQAAPE